MPITSFLSIGDQYCVLYCAYREKPSYVKAKKQAEIAIKMEDRALSDKKTYSVPDEGVPCLVVLFS